MKIAITAFITLMSVLALADIPRPHVEPGQPKTVEAEELNVLLYGAPASKVADLKSGSNTIKVERQNLKPGSTKYVYTSRKCSYGIAGYLCLENKQMTITKTETVGPDHSVVKYQVSEVLRAR
ncbi:MAG: hypothetical protein ABL930_01000 [Pseudobdellovibrio sp.]